MVHRGGQPGCARTHDLETLAPRPHLWPPAADTFSSIFSQSDLAQDENQLLGVASMIFWTITSIGTQGRGAGSTRAHAAACRGAAR